VRAFQFIEGGARYGAAVSVMNTAEGMRECEIAVEFGVFAGRPLGEALRENRFVVHEIPAHRRIDFRGIRTLVKLLRTRRFNLVHTHLSRATTNGLVAARLTRTPIVSTVHGMNRKYTYMYTDHIMTVSEAAKRHLMAQGVDEGRITPVYNCIQTAPFDARPDKAVAKAAFGFAPKTYVLGTISRAHRQKGIDVAIAAVADLRGEGVDAKYLFIGDGPHLGEFKALAAELGIADHAVFPGFSPAVVEALSAMDVFLFPTHREAFGISLLEAMAAEVPIVASSVDGVPEVLDEGSGVLLGVRTPYTFAHAAYRLMEDAGYRDEIVANARTRVETVFSVQNTARSVERVYRQILRRSEPTPRHNLTDVL